MTSLFINAVFCFLNLINLFIWDRIIESNKVKFKFYKYVQKKLNKSINPAKIILEKLRKKEVSNVNIEFKL